MSKFIYFLFRRRTFFMLVMLIIAVLFAHSSKKTFWLGLPFCLVGEGIRLWSSGYLKKKCCSYNIWSVCNMPQSSLYRWTSHVYRLLHNEQQHCYFYCSAGAFLYISIRCGHLRGRALAKLFR